MQNSYGSEKNVFEITCYFTKIIALSMIANQNIVYFEIGIYIGRVQELLNSYGGMAMWWGIFKTFFETKKWNECIHLCERYMNDLGYGRVPQIQSIFGYQPVEQTCVEIVNGEARFSLVQYDFKHVAFNLAEKIYVTYQLANNLDITTGGEYNSYVKHLEHCLQQIIRIAHLFQTKKIDINNSQKIGQLGLNVGRADSLMYKSFGENNLIRTYFPLMQQSNWKDMIQITIRLIDLLSSFTANKILQPSDEFINTL